ncbi:MAG: protein kinase [Deltaproteobacteria bacterium]|nr:protein kinase [Deltaproteobacteria bacterium]
MTPPEEASPGEGDRNVRDPQTGDQLLGKVIAGNFRIARLIGSGAMGNVYQAEQLSLGKEVAVKVLHPHLMSDEKLVRRFQREAKSASRLNHPNSIQIIDSGRDADGTLYIAMELLTGRDLSQIIRDEFPMPVPRITRIMSQVLSALDEAHAHGVIHRDLKPSNIMLIERRGEPDFVKVCDYGIAKAQLEESAADAQMMLTIQGLVCGTPEYMSPEQARGEPLDGRTDLYSAAVILYHMVTGDIPFRAATPIGIVSRHLSETPAVPSARRQDPAIPPDLDDLILRGLAKSRELRPASAAIFREELENIGTGRVGRRLRGDSRTVPTRPQVAAGDGETISLAAVTGPRRRGKTGKPLAIALVLVAVGGAVLMVMNRRPRLPPGAQLPPTVSISSLSGAGVLPMGTGTASPAKAEESSVQGAPGIPSQDDKLQKDVTPLPPVPEGAGKLNVSGTIAKTAPPRRLAALSKAASALAESARRRKQGPPQAARATSTGGKSDGAPGTSGPPSPSPSVVTSALSTTPVAASGSTATEAKANTGGASNMRSQREVISEAERLLSQGEIAEACRRGEEAKEENKKAAPRLALIHKFLGKCYMRAGDPGRAKENYRRYLELAPGAPDAMFIESIVK